MARSEKNIYIYVRLLTDRLSNSEIFTFKQSTNFSGFLKLASIGMCWPDDDKHLGTLPIQFNKGQFGASIMLRFLWVVWACRQGRRDVSWGEERKMKTVLTRNLPILIKTREERSLSLYITPSMFTQSHSEHKHRRYDTNKTCVLWHECHSFSREIWSGGIAWFCARDVSCQNCKCKRLIYKPHTMYLSGLEALMLLEENYFWAYQRVVKSEKI